MSQGSKIEHIVEDFGYLSSEENENPKLYLKPEFSAVMTARSYASKSLKSWN